MPLRTSAHASSLSGIKPGELGFTFNRSGGDGGHPRRAMKRRKGLKFGTVRYVAANTLQTTSNRPLVAGTS